MKSTSKTTVEFDGSGMHGMAGMSLLFVDVELTDKAGHFRTKYWHQPHKFQNQEKAQVMNSLLPNPSYFLSICWIYFMLKV